MYLNSFIINSIKIFILNVQTAQTAPHVCGVVYVVFMLARCGCGLSFQPNRIRGLVWGFKKKPHHPHRDHPITHPDPPSLIPPPKTVGPRLRQWPGSCPWWSLSPCQDVTVPKGLKIHTGLNLVAAFLPHPPQGIEPRDFVFPPLLSF